ncbi:MULTISPECIES: antitoxin VbhA family protein [unclassified Halomonas]|nr:MULTISPECIES: antitoxin VbhA family protein [unclassified Halomonas]MBT2786751.1 antitoxin VbhA family protein [Halomonas sp. ISL-106]
MTFRVEPDLRTSFRDAAESEHRPAAQVLRELMRDYVEQARARTSTISPAERKRREEAVNYGRASVGLEGLKLSEADERHAQRFINGEIELDEFIKIRNESLQKR